MSFLRDKCFLWLCIVLTLFFLSACSGDEKFVVEKPASVPDTANLVGGYDGWLWLDCRVESFDGLKCTIYSQNGELDRAVFLKPCLNLYAMHSSTIMHASSMHDSVIYFSNVPFFEYRPAEYPDGGSYGEDLANKYYDLLGVDDHCRPVGTELGLIEPPVGED